jgi:hypothetical protein
VADLEIGDFWIVRLPSGRLGAMQVRDLKRSGPGARTTFVAGVIDWSGSDPPATSDLRGRRVVAQGLTRIEAFTESGAMVLGNAPDTVAEEGLTSSFRDFNVGDQTEAWGWKLLARRVESALHGSR